MTKALPLQHFHLIAVQIQYSDYCTELLKRIRMYSEKKLCIVVADSRSAMHSSTIRCNNVIVSSTSNSGVTAGIIHLGSGATIERKISGPTGKTTQITSIRNANGVNIETVRRSCSSVCSEACTSEVRVPGVHVSSVVCNIGPGINITRRSTVHNMETGVHVTKEYHTTYEYPEPRHQQRSASKGVTNRMMIFVSDNVGSDWRTLGAQLIFSFEELDQLCLDHGHLGRKEPCYQMLISWKRKRGQSATREALLQALNDIDRKDIALRLPA